MSNEQEVTDREWEYADLLESRANEIDELRSRILECADDVAAHATIECPWAVNMAARLRSIAKGE
jgi:hypothetical protein